MHPTVYGSYFHKWGKKECAAVKGMVFKQYSLG